MIKLLFLAQGLCFKEDILLARKRNSCLHKYLHVSYLQDWKEDWRYETCKKSWDAEIFRALLLFTIFSAVKTQQEAWIQG